MGKIILSTESVKYPLTGIGRYTLELSKSLLAMLPQELFYCCDGHHVRNVSSWLESINNNEFGGSVVYSKIKSLAKKSKLINELYFYLMQNRLSVALSCYEDSLYHSTNFVCPNFAGYKVVTLHDMSAYLWPDCQETHRVSILRKQCEDSIKRADAIITVSHSSQREISQLFGYPMNKIFVTHLACSSGFKPRLDEEIKGCLNIFGLHHKRYSLFVGTIEPRKNLDTLIRAYEALPTNLLQTFPLVVVGYRGWKSEKTHHKLKKAQDEGWLKYLSYVSEIELQKLYSGARLFCFPSLYEGFGMPVLEAMASGVPVLASNSSSLPEVIDVAGRLLPTNDVNSWEQAIQEVLEDDVLAKNMSEKGILRAKAFSWGSCANSTIRAYKSVLSQ